MIRTVPTRTIPKRTIPKRTMAVMLAMATLPLAAQIPDEVVVTRVAAGMRYPAGLAWSRDGFLVIADAEKQEMYRLDPKQRPKISRDDPNAVQGLAYDSQSRLYLCEPVTRRLARLDRKGSLETIAASFEGRKFNSPADVVVRRDGQVYFTDPAFAGAIDRRELNFNGIFHVDSKGDIEAIARWQTRPNGIALSADGKRLFVTDADRHAVVQFDLDSKGAATASHDFITGIRGVPAGLHLDVMGRLYVCASGVAIYTAEGKLMRTLMDGQRTINLTFGGANLEVLYVATLREVFDVTIGVKGAAQY